METEHKEVTQITQPGGNTNPRYRKCCFTINNPEEEEFPHLLKLFDNEDYRYIIGKEVGESGTPHLQGYVEFNGRQLSLRQLKAINARAHWERARGDRKSNVSYCSKEGDFVTNIPVERRLRILATYSEILWKPWQTSIIELCRETPDPRTIRWYWDIQGNAGKSFLAKYLILQHDAVICSGKSNDIFNQVNVWINNHDDDEDPRLFIMDVPRCSIDYINYQAIEAVKNGCLYSGKYEGGLCVFDPPHVLVFANCQPDFSKMSDDRWSVVQIPAEQN